MTNKLSHYIQRDAFSIKDIAIKFNTTIDDILHIAKDEHITLEYLVKSERKINLAVPEFYQNKDGMMVESYGKHRSINLKIGDCMEISVGAIKQLLANRFFYEGDNMDHELYGDGFVVANNVDQGEKITIDDVIMSSNSNSQLSNLLSNQTHSNTQQVEETEFKRAQKTLVAIVYGLMQSHKHTYKNGDKPNISAIVEMALTGVADANGNAKMGFGKTTLTDTINEALKSFPIKNI